MLLPAPAPGPRGAGHGDRPLGAGICAKLGASPLTRPEMLCSFAEDSSAAMRAAVPMNPRSPTEADCTVVQDEDERARMMLARKLAELSPELGITEQKQLRDQAFGLLAQLVEDEAVRVRAAIADV